MEETKPVERWLPIAGYEGIYEVSDHGRVKRIIDGKQGTAKAGKILSCYPNKDGYIVVTLFKDGKSKVIFLHVLLALTFIGPIPEDKEVNHKDGVKNNFSLKNFEYLTHSENMKHAYREGLLRPANIKLTTEQVKEIRKSPLGCRRLGKKYGVTYQSILNIMNNKTWKRDW